VANPTNTSKKSNCGNPTTTECVTWQGENIPCLGIERGQFISESVKLVADEVCILKSTLDLTDLDLKCVFDLCLSCPDPEKTLKVVLQLIINKICTINQAIANLSVSTSTNSDPLVRLASCFQYTNDNGDLVIELAHSDYTRRIANAVCTILLDISTLQNDIDDLRDRVLAVETRVNNFDSSLPDVDSSCLFVGVRPVNEAYSLLDQAFCQLRGATGNTTDINRAVSQQCSDLNAEFAATPGWSLNPVNLAQTIQNMWIVMCKRSAEVKSIQDTCCAITCDDVKIGFVVLLNTERNEATIRFTSGAGTQLPAGFADAGSVMTITDKSGNSVDFNVPISNNGEEVIDLTGLNTADQYSFDLDAKVSNGALTCQKCISRTATVQDTCTFCEITNIGTTGQIVIVYE